MTKYKLEISNAISGQTMPAVEFEEKIQEEAKAKSYKVLLDAVDNYPDGEFVGVLYRKMFIGGWQSVSAPVISCVVSAGKVTLTVKRPRYNREVSLLGDLKQHCNTLSSFIQTAAQSLLFSTPIDPAPAIKLMDDIKQTLRTLLNDYRPEYLDANIYNQMESQIDNSQNALQTTYKAYAHTALSENYTTTLTAELQKVQLLLLTFIQNNNL